MNDQRLWENYAKNYSGICIEYKKQDFVNRNFHIMPVYYKKKKLVSDFFSFVPKNRGKSIELKQNEKFHPSMLLAYKTLKWDYEKEWRHIEFIKEDELPAIGIYNNDPMKILNNVTIEENNIKQKNEEISELKNIYLNGLKKTSSQGKLISAIKPNKIFIGENMKKESVRSIVVFCKNNDIGYEIISPTTLN